MIDNKENGDVVELASELAALDRMRVGELQRKLEELTGRPTRSRNRSYLVRRIAWLLQAIVEGGLTRETENKIEELLSGEHALVTKWCRVIPNGEKIVRGDRGKSRKKANNGRDPRLPSPGTVLVKRYKGRDHQVIVLRKGFRYEGRFYKSITSVANTIARKKSPKSHWSGYAFFGLGRLSPR